MSKEMCTCTEEKAGPCRTREIEEHEVYLSTDLIREHISPYGFEETLAWTAHTWYDWVHPDHDEEICDEFNLGATVLSASSGERFVLVNDGTNVWCFRTEPLDPADFPAGPED